MEVSIEDGKKTFRQREGVKTREKNNWTRAKKGNDSKNHFQISMDVAPSDPLQLLFYVMHVELVSLLIPYNMSLLLRSLRGIHN